MVVGVRVAVSVIDWLVVVSVLELCRDNVVETGGAATTTSIPTDVLGAYVASPL